MEWAHRLLENRDQGNYQGYWILLGLCHGGFHSTHVLLTWTFLQIFDIFVRIQYVFFKYKQLLAILPSLFIMPCSSTSKLSNEWRECEYKETTTKRNKRGKANEGLRSMKFGAIGGGRQSPPPSEGTPRELGLRGHHVKGSRERKGASREHGKGHGKEPRPLPKTQVLRSNEECVWRP